MPPAATPEPTATPSLRMVTVLPASAVPLNVAAATFVMLSVLEEPESDAAARSGVLGAVGARVSMVTERLDAAALVLPAVSVAVAVMLCVPAASAEVVIE